MYAIDLQLDQLHAIKHNDHSFVLLRSFYSNNGINCEYHVMFQVFMFPTKHENNIGLYMSVVAVYLCV